MQHFIYLFSSSESFLLFFTIWLSNNLVFPITQINGENGESYRYFSECRNWRKRIVEDESVIYEDAPYSKYWAYLHTFIWIVCINVEELLKRTEQAVERSKQMPCVDLREVWYGIEPIT